MQVFNTHWQFQTLDTIICTKNHMTVIHAAILYRMWLYSDVVIDIITINDYWQAFTPLCDTFF